MATRNYTRRFCLFILGAGFLAVLLALPRVALADDAWMVGMASQVITPNDPIWMAGYASRSHPATGTQHDLWIKVLALEDSRGKRGLVVTSDILGFSKSMYENIYTELNAMLGLERSEVILNSSHTHTGPVIDRALQDIYPISASGWSDIDAYSNLLEITIVAKANEAFDNMAPATLWTGRGSTDFAVNRRNNSESNVVYLRENGLLEGPVDHDVPVLAVRDLQGNTLSATFGYACHGTTLNNYNWSGDYAGFAQLDLQQNTPGMMAMYWSGCGADQNPLPRRTLELAEGYGEMLSDAVEDALNGPLESLNPVLQTGFEFIDLEYSRQPTRAELVNWSDDGGYRGRWATRLLGELDAGGVFPTSYPYPLQVWRLDDQIWITMGGEVVVDYSLMLKEKYGPDTWISGYTNDVMAYIPSHRIWSEGGYEAGAFEVYGLPALRWEEGIEDKILDAIERILVSFLPGDANGDGRVDDADAAVMAANWQSQNAGWSEGDFNGDGKVTDVDATILAANWHAPAAASTSIPEPSMMTLLAGILLAVLTIRKGRNL